MWYLSMTLTEEPQCVELAHNPLVEGSSPSRPTNIAVASGRLKGVRPTVYSQSV